MARNVLILGRSEHGKSSMAEYLTLVYQSQGIETIVMEPLDTGREWPGSLVIKKAYKFLEVAGQKKNCALFIEEYARTLNSEALESDSPGERGRKRADIENKMMELATGGRHRRHVMHFSCHRLTQLDWTLRDACPELYLFACSAPDAKKCGEDYGHLELDVCTLLQPGQFAHVEPGLPAEWLQIEFETLEITEMQRAPRWSDAEGGA